MGLKPVRMYTQERRNQVHRGNRMKIEQYDRILLKDGRTASVVEILEEGSAYLVDVDLPGPDWDTVEIRQSDILTNIESQTRKENT